MGLPKTEPGATMKLVGGASSAREAGELLKGCDGMNTTGIETEVSLTPEPVQVPDAPEGAKAVVVQLWVRSSAGSWSGCLSNGQAEDLGRKLVNAARRAHS